MNLLQLLSRIWQRRITGDLVFLYLAFFANYIFPLATIPFLSRTLQVSGWGQLVMVQSFSQLVLVFLSFGFSLHGTRMIARHRDDQKAVNAIHSEITRARAFLIIPTGLIFVATCAAVPNLRQHLPLAALGFLNAAAMAFSPGWVLQGLDKMRLYSAMDTLAKLIAFLGIFVFIRQPEDAWLVLAMQAASMGIVTLLSYGSIWRQYPLRLSGGGPIWPIFRQSSTLFLFSLSATIVNQTNAFVLGLFVSPAAVGIYSGGEKVVRAACGLVGPFTAAVHAKLNYRLGKDPAAARLLFLRSTAFLLVSSVALCLVLFFGSDLLVRFALGPSFSGSAPVIRVLSLIIVANWLSNHINLNYLISQHLDLPLMRCVIFAAGVSIAATCVLCPRFSSIGMAFAAVAAEFALLGALLIYLFRCRNNFYPQRAPQDIHTGVIDQSS